MNKFALFFQEYAESLGFDLCFQNFEEELSSLPGNYIPPKGSLLLALRDGKIAGCVAMRPITNGICEMKRLYVKPQYRGKGIGRALSEAIIAEARKSGYQMMRLDTTPSMTKAKNLYKSLGFKEISPYHKNPIPDVIYLDLDLY